MATNLDIITEAYQLANITNDREVLNSRQSTKGLTFLNDMMIDWQEDGIELGYYRQTLLNDTFPVEDRYFRGVKYNLSLGIAGANGVVAPEETRRIAGITFDRLAKATIDVVDTKYNHMPTGGRSGFNVETG
jgi:hypothetical protein|tara:strand:+ start:4592 stop:4987 length:396 start_codon:yes stop_codon:yes gene_type:complete